MKILVLGGAGIVGKAITKDLLEQPDVSKVVITGEVIKKRKNPLTLREKKEEKSA